MDLLTAIHVIIRHWLVLIIALLVAGGALLALDRTMQPTYSGVTTVLLLPPRSGGVHQQPPANDKNAQPKLINPYLSFDSTIYVLARVVIEDLSTDESKARLQVGGSHYEATIKPDAPMITVTATGHSERDTLATRDTVVAAAADDLINRQRAAGVPEDTWATVTLVSRPERATQTTDKLKILAAVAALGVASAIGLTFVVESLMTGRRQRRDDTLAQGDVPLRDDFRHGGERMARHGQPSIGSRGPEGLSENAHRPGIDVKDTA